MSAASALIKKPDECGGTTPRNGQQHFDMLPTDPLAASLDECVSSGADEIAWIAKHSAEDLYADLPPYAV